VPRTPIRVSLGSWAFSFGPYADHPVPFEQAVQRLAQAGYDGVEISGFSPHISLDRYPTSESRREVAGLLADCGLGVSGYSPDYSEVNPCGEGNRTRYLELFQRYLDLCSDLSIPVIRVDSGSAPGSLDEREYQQAFHRLAGIWREAADLAAKAGVKVAWEFEPGFVFNKPSEVIAMHEEVAHPAFRVLFDTAHAYLSANVGARQQGRKETLPGGVGELLAKLRDRIGAVHLIDSDGSLYADETSTHVPLGEGRIDFASVIPGLLRLPGIEWWCIDMCFCPGSWELVERELTWVRDVLSRAAAA
jgi:sugar phosphate isomerase/epimerase